MTPDAFIDRRRKKLRDLSSELPDSYTLGEGIYAPLFSDKWWSSPYPPFKSFDKLAKILVEKNDAFQHAFKFWGDFPMHHIVDVKTSEDAVLLTISHSHRISSGDLLLDGNTTIKLSRVAGHIGYGKPQVHVERWTGSARKILKTPRV